ncbi:hypothetical protein [Kribbella sp. NPDC004875]|uniref:hypothetical protein n=1 Tax=Kribbella sp. NPDC004875 TaxID=3364107 RepID=UPI0036B03667
MIGSPKLAAWLIVTIGAFVALLAWIFPDAVRHRGQIDAAGTEVVVCTAGAQQLHDGRTQVLHHLADCAGDNTAVRSEMGDELAALVLLAFTVAGTWQVTRAARH